MSIKRFYTYVFFILALVWSPCYGDAVAPRPNSMKWMTVPTTLGPTTITMGVPTALDAGGDYPVQYYFECTTDGSRSSDWQTGTTYAAEDLNALTTYIFRVKARDSYLMPNETEWSSSEPATTEAAPTDIEILGSWATGNGQFYLYLGDSYRGIGVVRSNY